MEKRVGDLTGREEEQPMQPEKSGEDKLNDLVGALTEINIASDMVVEALHARGRVAGVVRQGHQACQNLLGELGAAVLPPAAGGPGVCWW